MSPPTYHNFTIVAPSRTDAQAALSMAPRVARLYASALRGCGRGHDAVAVVQVIGIDKVDEDKIFSEAITVRVLDGEGLPLFCFFLRGFVRYCIPGTLVYVGLY